MTVLGIDVSTYQPKTPPLAAVGFLFARASIGTRKDDRYDMHITNARKAGIVTGAYHFGIKTLSPIKQARAFMAAAGDVDFYFLDVEGKQAPTLAQVREFFYEVRRHGKKVGLYHSRSGFFEAGQDYNWVAAWGGTPPSMNWTFWQYTSDGGLPGYTARLDMNRFIGTLGELRKLAAHPPDTGTGDDMGQINITGSPRDAKLVDLPDGTQLYAMVTPLTPLVKVSRGGADTYSPFESGSLRTVDVSVGGQRQLALVKTADVKNIRPLTPVVDCSEEVAAATVAGVGLENHRLSGLLGLKG